MEEIVKLPNSQFSIGNIILIESNFSRSIEINAVDVDKVKQDILIELNHSDISKEIFAVFMAYTFKILYNDELIVNAYIKYSGEFKADGVLTLKQKEDFANVNAPAMLYPFIRENIATLTSKAMVGTVLIPPVNFIQMYQEKKVNSATK